MQKCSYCGHKSSNAALFCAQCGQSLTVAQPDPHDRYFLAQERHQHRQRIRRINREGSNESLEFYTKVIAIIAVLHGLTLFLQSNTNILLNQWGPWLIAAALLAATIRTIHDQRLGYSIVRSLSETAIVGLLLYGIIYGIFWYLDTNFMSNPEALRNLFLRSTPTPNP